MADCPNCYYIVVVEDTLTNMLIGSGTLVKEQKFIHQCSSVSIFRKIKEDKRKTERITVNSACNNTHGTLKIIWLHSDIIITSEVEYKADW